MLARRALRAVIAPGVATALAAGARVRATAGRVGMRRFLRSGAHRVAVAVLTSGNPDRAYAQQTLRGVFARLLRGLAAQEVLTPT